VSEVKTPYKVCLYGRSKTGKTRLACGFPKPLLIMGTEDGTRSVRNVAGVDFVRVYAVGEVAEVTQYLRSGKYRTAVLDTAGGLQSLVVKDFLDLDEVPLGKTWGMTDMRGWGVVGAQTNEYLNRLFYLADAYGVHVVITAHERTIKEEGVSSDVITPTVCAALTPTSAGWLNAASDFIGHTFISQEVRAEEVDLGDGTKQTLQTPTGKVEYRLRVGGHPVYVTGFRVTDTVKLPDSILDPTFTKLSKIIDEVRSNRPGV
jgi:hypothetical protein